MDATAACCLLVLFSELGIIMMASLHVCRGSVHGALPGNDTTAIQAAEPLPAAILVEGINHLIEAGPAGDYYRSALFSKCPARRVLLTVGSLLASVFAERPESKNSSD